MTSGHQVRDYLGCNDFYETYFFGHINGNSGGHKLGQRVPYKFIDERITRGENPDAVLIKVKVFSFNLEEEQGVRSVSLGRHLDDVVYKMPKRKDL